MISEITHGKELKTALKGQRPNGAGLTVDPSVKTAEGLKDMAKRQNEVASHYAPKSAAERQSKALSRKEKTTLLVLGGLTLLGVGHRLAEEPNRDTVTINADAGDTASQLAQEFNPNEDWRDEADQIQEQIDAQHKADPDKSVGAMKLEVPYSTIPEDRKDNVVQ